MALRPVNIEKLVAETDGLPILSETAEKVFDCLVTPGTTAKELTEVIEENPPAGCV